jgi:hypothetical protein
LLLLLLLLLLHQPYMCSSYCFCALTRSGHDISRSIGG